MVAALDEILGYGAQRTRVKPVGRDEQVKAGVAKHARRSGFGRVAADFSAASRASGHSRRRKQQAQVVVDFGYRADRRTGVADGVLLAQSKRWRDVRDRVNVRPLDPLQEQPRVSGEALNVTALSLGVKRIEDEARLARARHARYHGELPVGQVEGDVLQVVSAGAADADPAFQTPHAGGRPFSGDPPALWLSCAARRDTRKLPARRSRRV